MPIIVYSKPDCPQCDLTKRDMDILGIPYETVDLTRRQDQLERLAGLGLRSLPVVETDQGTWSGHNQERIRQLVSLA